MKIAYNWLKEYVNTNLQAEQVGELLTDCGLEVEAIEQFEMVKGGLKGMVVGEVKTKEKHPDADRLNLTTVDIGTGTLLHIVCGASNVEVGQKVIVATIGATLYPTTGEPFEIKKSKIRGQLSEGMICAEDEIGLGTSHAGIMVLNEDAVVGMPAAGYFKLKSDAVFEIGLTPNRADAASHVGVARDVVASLNCKAKKEERELISLKLPNVDLFQPDNNQFGISVTVEDAVACPRYSGVTIQHIKVSESPEWLKNKLKSIGVRSINNVVDITNYVLHELGQPMHAFDAAKIKGDKVIVKKLKAGSKFVSLDGVERSLSDDDLMICDGESNPMCIAGVFGGINSGVTEQTTTVFLESAYFNSTSIRKSSKRHGLKTDASFRYERGADPNITVYALKRAALLIKQICGGEISSDIIDLYPKKIENFKVAFSFSNCAQLVGKRIDNDTIKNIIYALGIDIEQEGNDALLLSVPPFKVDVQREQDVIEEILRIYGYNNIEIPVSLNSSLTFGEKPDKEKIQNAISDLLSNNGFSEIMGLSLTKAEYSEKLQSLNPAQQVLMLNPLSTDLNAMRQTLLFGGLETIVYNQNRKKADLRLYEFGKTYSAIKNDKTTKYIESKQLAVFITGRKEAESWNSKTDAVNFYTLKGIVASILERLNITISVKEYSGDVFSQALSYHWNKKNIVEFGSVSKPILKMLDIKQEVFYAAFNWDVIVEAIATNKPIMYTEVAKFPEVKRDLALLIDKAVPFEQLETLAYQSEKTVLKSVNLFDVYEGDKLPKGKKSYALSFILQDENATLTDKQIEKIMEKLIKTYQEKVGAEIR
ncbi:MAG TPA: phenylalanine--tRNA ligase subunit beta [Bacteroidia bacterium]|jgi:phenylalanyl-tRNA synthetase beta chain|nr:phenylalanine--tRNA ligase subunit beta [Bacteroidia bacterium]